MQLSQIANKTCGVSERRALACYAQKNNNATRRAGLFGLLGLTIAANSSPSMALIPLDSAPDLESPEIQEKLRENRKRLVEQQTATNRQFLDSVNQRNANLSNQLKPLEAGVKDLRKAGKKLADGDIKGAAQLITESQLINELEASIQNVTYDKTGTDLGAVFIQEVQTLQSVVKDGNLAASKKQYAAMVTALESWSDEQTATNYLQGLKIRKRVETGDRKMV